MQKLASWYGNLAILVLNTLLFLLLITCLLLIAVKWFVKDDSPGSLVYGDDLLSQAYPGWGRADYEAMLREIWTRPLVCAPLVGYREAPYSGKYVHVSEAGFRWNEASLPWPPDGDALTIFVFGGSTTFGYGVPDDETIPAYMQHDLSARFGNQPVHVYNFGNAYYASDQEIIQLIVLLQDGLHPDVAVFIDGLNELESQGVQNRLVQCGDKTESPLNTAFDDLWQAIRGDDNANSVETRMTPQQIIDKWMVNRTIIQAIAAEYDVQPYFIWQPIPYYHYDRNYRIFESGDYPQLTTGYEYLASLRPQWETWDNFLDLSDVQRDVHRLLYVDRVHYTGAFNAQLAEFIADFLMERADFM